MVSFCMHNNAAKLIFNIILKKHGTKPEQPKTTSKTLRLRQQIIIFSRLISDLFVAAVHRCNYQRSNWYSQPYTHLQGIQVYHRNETLVENAEKQNYPNINNAGSLVRGNTQEEKEFIFFNT